LIVFSRLPRPWLTLTILMLGILLWSINKTDKNASSDKVDEGLHVPSYFVRSLVMREFDINGEPARYIETPMMTEFLDDKTTEMQTPYYVFTRPAQPAWHVRAENGWLSADRQLALLSGRVTMTREGTADSLPIKMVSSEVRIQPKSNYMETDNHVKIDSGDDVITATGMQAWLTTPGRVKFLNNVRSTYVPRKKLAD